MSTNWTPTAGMRRAHDLVEQIATEAGLADSTITPLFKHRMVELIGREIDDAVHGVPADDSTGAITGRYDAPTFAGVTIIGSGGGFGGSVARDATDSSVTGLPATTPHTNGHAKPAQTARSRSRKAKGGKKGTLRLTGAAKRIADKKLREAAAAQAMENLPVPVDGLERE